MQIIKGKYFVSHSFSGFENFKFVLYKYRVDCFGSLRFFVAVVRSLGKPVSFVFLGVLMFSPTSSRENKTNCFPRDLTLSVLYYLGLFVCLIFFVLVFVFLSFFLFFLSVGAIGISLCKSILLMLVSRLKNQL